jgi:GNAT superfamily N-acetyltransferase
MQIGHYVSAQVRWGPIAWPGGESDVEACVRLVVALGAGEDAAWRQTLTRTVRDGKRRALFVAEAHGQVAGHGRVVCIDADPQVEGAAPAGWYLLGLVVDRAWRRRGIGEALTRGRIAWVAEQSPRVYYFTGRGNLASQALHQRLGLQKCQEPGFLPGAARGRTLPAVLPR